MTVRLESRTRATELIVEKAAEEERRLERRPKQKLAAEGQEPVGENMTETTEVAETSTEVGSQESS